MYDSGYRRSFNEFISYTVKRPAYNRQLTAEKSPIGTYRYMCSFPR